jgi:aspartate/methionine/tyrosine aminotransferase
MIYVMNLPRRSVRPWIHPGYNFLMNLFPFKLERYFARYEFSARYLLCSSDCESQTIADLLALEPGAQERLQGLWLGYTESAGAPSLRREISRGYTAIAADQVLVHSGAEEAIFLFMHAVLQPGDHVVVHWPCYQSLEEVPRSLGCAVTRWQAQPGNGWAPDLDELPRLLQPNTRAVVLNTPHNPTGWLMPPAEFEALNRLCLRRGILLFSDEVYRETELDPAQRLPAACDLNPLAVSLGVMSKSYGLPGLRIGWIATQNEPVRARMAALKDYTTICSSAPSEFLAELALRHREQLAARSRAILAANLQALDGFFTRRASLFEWVRPRAGSVAFPRLLQGDVEAFCHDLVTRAGVLLLPGALFNFPGGWFRLGFGRKNMPEALAQLEAYLGQG